MMRGESIRAIEQLALGDPRVVIVASDPSADFMPELRKRFPERLQVEGVCEQGLVGMCAGLASEGFYPYMIMLAVFGTRRCYEQLLLDFGLHKCAGCVVGVGGGLSYSTLGPTHLAVDDLLLTSAIPGSVVLAPADAAEAVTLIRAARAQPALSYLRLSASVQNLAHVEGEIVLGRCRYFEAPAPVHFVSCGAATLATEEAVLRLRDHGIRACVTHVHTVKPLDAEFIRRRTADARVILCVEEHRQIGGLSSAVLRALEKSPGPRVYQSVGVDDAFPGGFGTYEDMMEQYGITAASLAEEARKLCLGHRD